MLSLEYVEKLKSLGPLDHSTHTTALHFHLSLVVVNVALYQHVKRDDGETRHPEQSYATPM